VLFKLKPYLVKRQLKNYPTAKIKSIKDFKSGEKIPRMKQNPHELLIKRELDNLLIVMNERTLLSIPEDCKKSTDIKGWIDWLSSETNFFFVEWAHPIFEQDGPCKDFARIEWKRFFFLKI
jgi:hypothetical protein